MADKAYTVAFRRRRQGKTNYKKRIELLKSGRPRLVIRRSLNSITVQFITFDQKGDKVVSGVNSRELAKHGWKFNKKNIPSAYLTGYLAGAKAKSKKITSVILDIGLQQSVKGSRIYAALKGVIEAGITVSHSKEMFPDEKRLKGTHISSYYSQKKGNQFSTYSENDVAALDKKVEEIKSKVQA